jgi:hypothetical protein
MCMLDEYEDDSHSSLHMHQLSSPLLNSQSHMLLRRRGILRGMLVASQPSLLSRKTQHTPHIANKDSIGTNMLPWDQ